MVHVLSKESKSSVAYTCPCIEVMNIISEDVLCISNPELGDWGEEQDW